MIPRFLLAAAALLLTVAGSSAIVLDWSALPGGATWANGATSGSYNPDPANAGNDITISFAIAGSGASYTANFPQNAKADGVSTIANNDANSLHLRVPTFGDATGKITCTITFNYTLGVNNVSFNLLDIDKQAGTWIDEISAIQGTSLTNTAVPLTVALANPGGTTPAATITGSGLSTVVLGSTANITDHTGDVSFNSGSTVVKSVTFTWSNPGPDFGGQVIALSNISFTPVPEANSMLSAIALSVGAVGLQRLGRRRSAPATT